MRIWEIDLLRGLAVLLMIAFHLVVDLRDFFGFSLNYHSGIWFFVGKLAACLFILLAGVSSRFSRNCLRHGLRILGWGMVLSLVTYYYDATLYIRFGILHLLGTSLIIGSFLRQYRPILLFTIGLFILLVGNFWSGAIWLRQAWLLPFGYPPPTFTTLDYYPLFPWLGLFFIGMAMSFPLYRQPLSLLSQPLPLTPLHWLGRNALAVYLLHQPILLLILYLAFQSNK